jgi:hypothetical protein
MPDRGDTRRRIAIYAVTVVGVAATIATSPPHVESRVQSSTKATVHLDGATPRSVGRFTLTLSPEVLPEQSSSGPQPTGTVTFTPDMRDAGVPVSGQSNPVLISAAAVGIPDPPKVDGSASSWPIANLCRLAEPCRREFEVTAEWLRPAAGRSIDFPINANLDIVYDRWESPPPGATASWAAGEFVAAAASPTLPTSLDLGAVSLGPDSPMAARHVLLTASAEVLNEPTRTDLTAYVRAETGSDPSRAVTVTLLPDPASDQGPRGPQPSSVPAGTFVTPFSGCIKGQDCTRGFTIFAQWEAVDPNRTIDVDWSFEAVARFAGAERVPDQATLTAKVDEAIDLDATSPRTTAHAEGSFELGEANQGRRQGSVRLKIDGPSPGNQFLGAAPPAVAVIHLHAAAKDPSPSAQLILWVSSARRSGVDSVPVPDVGDVTSVALPLANCHGTSACSGFIELTVESKTAREATITWSVDANLPTPGSRPPGELRIAVVEAR